jgi:methylglyoxal reductase
VTRNLFLGTWLFGAKNFGKVDDSDSIAVIKLAIESGFTAFDTADFYGDGHAERVLAKALKGMPSSACYIATKGGLYWEGQSVFNNGSKSYLKEACYKSLERLDRDVIDLYYYHWPDKNSPLHESLEALNELKQEGVIRDWGLSNCDHISLDVEALAVYGDIPYQCHYNILHRDRLATHKHTLIPIAYSPLEQGLLSDIKFLSGNVSKKDIRNRNVYRSSDLHKTWLYDYFSLCKSYHVEPFEIAYSWLLNQSVIKGLVLGCRNITQFNHIKAYFNTDTAIRVIPPEIDVHINHVPDSIYTYG